MAKIHRSIFTDADKTKHVHWVFWCPGCEGYHQFDERWTKSGTDELPTFQPSLLVSPDDPSIRCHLFLQDGKLKFLGDCHHDLKGQTVDLPECDW